MVAPPAFAADRRSRTVVHAAIIGAASSVGGMSSGPACRSLAIDSITSGKGSHARGMGDSCVLSASVISYMSAIAAALTDTNGGSVRS
jgi:hypothetical protein